MAPVLANFQGFLQGTRHDTRDDSLAGASEQAMKAVLASGCDLADLDQFQNLAKVCSRNMHTYCV